MITRVSTPGFQLNTTLQLQQQRAELAKTQEQVASGQRITRPADDPIGAVRGLEIGRALQQTEQFDRNATVAQNRLQTQEGVLAEAGNILQRARDLALQGANASQGNDSRSFIASELRELSGAMLDAANTQDSSDNFIFSGFQAATQPFSPEPGGVVYNGDEGQRRVQIGPNRDVTDGNPGSEVFMRIREGNGVFKVEAADNDGTGVIKTTSVRDLQAFTDTTENFIINFLSDDQFEVSEVGGPFSDTREFRPGEAISFKGVSVILDGSPQAGDKFELSPSGNSSVFDTLDRLTAAFETPTVNPRDRAAQLNEINRALDDIDQATAGLLETRTETGARLKAIEDQQAINDGARVQLQTTRSGIEDLDFAEAITRLNRQQTGLQAAQQAFVRTQNLSLFNFL